MKTQIKTIVSKSEITNTYIINVSNGETTLNCLAESKNEAGIKNAKRRAVYAFNRIMESANQEWDRIKNWSQMSKDSGIFGETGKFSQKNY